MTVMYRFFLIAALLVLPLAGAHAKLRFTHRSHQAAQEMLVIQSGPQRWHFTVEVAKTPEQQAKGLMRRHQLLAHFGMLFLFPDMRDRQMWMKDTPLALDMLFIDSRGRIVYIAENTVPYS